MMSLSVMRQNFTTSHRTKSSTSRNNGEKSVKVRMTDLSAATQVLLKYEALDHRKVQKPRCFKGVEIEKGGIVYAANSNACMTGIIFDKWLHKFNLWMHGRKELLLFYNFFSQKVRRELNNVTVVFSRLTWLTPANCSMQLRVHIIFLYMRTYIYVNK